MMDATVNDLSLSSATQRFGALLAFDPDSNLITHVCETIADVMGQAPDVLLGAQLASVMPRGFIHELRNVMSLRHFADSRHFAGCHDMPMGARDVSVSQSTTTGHVVIEFETPSDSLHSADDFAAELRHLSSGLRSAGDDQKLLKAVASMLRFASGYDCALVYRFGPGGGDVIAEAGSVAQQKFLGKRLTYLENSPDARSETQHPILHFTADTNQARAGIIAADDAPAELDLSHCNLRGTSPSDIDALSAMGARAAMTLPIVMNSGFWGMALLLSQRPQSPSRYVRQLCDALALVVCDRLEILAYSSTAQRAVNISESADKPDRGGKSVLVVEDNRLIAADLKLTLLDLGFSTVDLFSQEAPALEHLAKNNVDLAVLDVRLEGTTTSFEVARKLADLGTPFLFASGYGATADLPDWLGHRPVVLKPASRRELSARIDELLAADPAGPARDNEM